MKRRNKGRKIYKTKEKNYYGKSPFGKFMSGALTVLLIGGIGFLGYSLAEPIVNYTQHKGDEPATEAPTTEAAMISEIPTEAISEEATVPFKESFYTAAALKASDMMNVGSLRSALAAVPQNEAEYVELPLKVSGGNIYYASSVLEAQTAIKSELTLHDIIKEIENSGFKPAAVISVFRDNIMSEAYPEGGYVLSDGGAQWTDSNGKSWTTPYSQRTLDYNANIVAELTSAGFEQIICSDLVFPDFTESDLQLLDPVLGQNDRCIALTSAANLLYDKTVSNGASMQIEISAEDILKGKADVLQPMLLSSGNIILNIDLDKLSGGISDGNTVYEFSGTNTEKIEKCLDLVNDKLVDFNAAIRLSGESLNYDELVEAKNALSDYGCKAYVIG